MKEGFTPNPVHAQYWVGKDGIVRIHTAENVIFAKRSEFIRAFNIKTRSEGKPCLFGHNIIRALARSKEPGKTTLKSMIESMTVENVIDATSIVISDEQVSRVLLVFDAESYDTLVVHTCLGASRK